MRQRQFSWHIPSVWYDHDIVTASFVDLDIRALTSKRDIKSASNDESDLNVVEEIDAKVDRKIRYDSLHWRQRRPGFDKEQKQMETRKLWTRDTMSDWTAALHGWAVEHVSDRIQHVCCEHDAQRRTHVLWHSPPNQNRSHLYVSGISKSNFRVLNTCKKELFETKNSDKRSPCSSTI